MKKLFKVLLTLFIVLCVGVGTFIFSDSMIDAASGNLKVTYPDGYTTGRIVY